MAARRPVRTLWIIYTDAATRPPILCDLLFRGNRSSPVHHTSCSARPPDVWPYFHSKNARIYGMELLATVLLVDDRASPHRGTCFWIYLDDNNCMAALVGGNSNTGVISVLVSRYWKMGQRFDICAWFLRVHAGLNPADLPTRGREIPFRPRVSAGSLPFRSMFSRIRSTLAVISDPPNVNRLRRVRNPVRKSPRRSILLG